MRCLRSLFVLPLALTAVPIAAQDPWSKVPDFPTSCYVNDDFGERLAIVRHELDLEADSQNNINGNPPAVHQPGPDGQATEDDGLPAEKPEVFGRHPAGPLTGR